MGMRKPIPVGLQVVPSLLAADFSRLAEEIRSVEEAGAAALHLDVMDGHFVPNITFGPPLVASVRATTALFLDTHLMIRDPLGFLAAFVRSGADLVTLHAEALGDVSTAAGRAAARAALATAAERCGSLGCGLGLSFRPVTDPLPLLAEAGELIDLVLIMTVEPGFGGQAFLETQLPRIAAARELRARAGWRYRIEVDGGVGRATAGACASAGADWLVAGTAVFGARDRRAAMAEVLVASRSGRSLSA
jgi:ribulose-phosphate 3-epimerase